MRIFRGGIKILSKSFFVSLGQYGIPKKWYFIFQPSYWCSKKFNNSIAEVIPSGDEAGWFFFKIFSFEARSDSLRLKTSIFSFISFNLSSMFCWAILSEFSILFLLFSLTKDCFWWLALETSVLIEQKI